MLNMSPKQQGSQCGFSYIVDEGRWNRAGVLLMRTSGKL